jgi:nitrogen fixation/metabolism regulation signal transduction histidine kinase
VAAGRLKRAAYTVALAFGTLLWLSVLLLFSQVAQNSDEFARLQPWILLVNVIGIAVLALLIVGNFVRLVADYRRHVPGSRLKARMMTMLVVLTVTPLLIVYTFAVQFINRGIDSWFDVDVAQGLENALELSQTAFDIQMSENLAELRAMAQRLSTSGRTDVFGELDQLRRESGALELTIFGMSNQILATSSPDPDPLVQPGTAQQELIFQLRQRAAGGTFNPDLAGDDSVFQLAPGDVGDFCCATLEPPQGGGGYEIIAAVNLISSVPTGVMQGLQGRVSTSDERVLQGRFAVEPRISELAELVEASVVEYRELDFLRNALKYSFTLTLSLVLLLTMLAAVYGAFFSARRLVVPIQQLMAGTRAVARGDFETQLPQPGRDEIGFLVNSFNDMTQRLYSAREETRRTQQAVENERRKLAVILARLSTGVISLEPDLRIRTANRAAGAILGVDLDAHVGESLLELAKDRPLLSQFVAVARAHLDDGNAEWREQIMLRGDVGRRVLMCACTGLSGEDQEFSGYVIVFDDITALMQAQRDAAWGEVARRLAHEIKNPLTPIQLSAERLRRRYLPGQLGDPELLDRATHTIIQQVEAMKEMVNAFGDYARTPEIDITRFDLNELVREVTELYLHRERPLAVELDLDSSLPLVEADAGRVRQVLHNLIRNALEAMERQSDERLTISTRHVVSAEVPTVEIMVADNGPGFGADIADQIFEPYVTSKEKGTGLGLAIVKKLVEEHGGHIEARNAEHGGAVISILLPISGEFGVTVHDTARRPSKRRQHA